MAEVTPDVKADIGPDGSPVLTVDGVAVTSVTELAERLSGLAEPLPPADYAEMLNFLLRGYTYSVIHAPDDFRKAYMALYEAEDPDTPVGPGELSLHSYDLPDFDAVCLPKLEDGRVVFFARHNRMQLPYRVSVSLQDGTGVYRPMDI